MSASDSSRSLRFVERFVGSVERGWITADQNTSAVSDLKAVTAMLRLLLQGDDPKSVFEIPDGRHLRKHQTETRNRNLAVHVKRLHDERGLSIEDAAEEIAGRAKLGFNRMAYSDSEIAASRSRSRK